jgi:hypothetical protein
MMMARLPVQASVRTDIQVFISWFLIVIEINPVRDRWPSKVD